MKLKEIASGLAKAVKGSASLAFSKTSAMVEFNEKVIFLLKNSGATTEQIQDVFEQAKYVPCDLHTFALKCVRYNMDIERAKWQYYTVLMRRIWQTN